MRAYARSGARIPQTKADDFKTEDVRVLKKLLPYLLKMRRRVVAAFLFLIFAKIANVAVPVALKEIVDYLDQPDILLVVPLGLLAAYGGLRLLGGLFNELRDAVFARVRYHTMNLVALGVFAHLHTLDLDFHLGRRIGGITRDIDRGTQSVSTLLSIFVFNILPTLFEIFLVIGILWGGFDIFFALTALVTVGAYIALTIRITHWRMQYRYQMNDMQSAANTGAVDSLINYETVKYFNREKFEHDRYAETMNDWENVAVKSFTSMTALNFIQGGVIALGVTIILALAASGVINDTLSLGDLIMIQALLLQLFLPLGTLGIIYRQIKHNFVDMNNMFELLDKKSTVEDAPGACDLVVSDGVVEFQNVGFSYPRQKHILRDLNLRVRRGRKIAIVGPSGAGKSTIVKLLFRFYDVARGEILIDGQNIRSVTSQSLRRAVAVVPQDIVLFNESIYDNIAYGRAGVSFDEVRQVAEKSHIHDFIESLPQGYDTIVGERGLKLSGGEKQRIAIARALLKNAPIMIFDEATSALDSHSERLVQSALEDIARHHTVIVIAHRLSTTAAADEIIVLEGGAVKERGTHQRLLSEQGLYARLWHMQSSGNDISSS